MAKQVKIIKLSGATGLRKPGTLAYFKDGDAKRLEKAGLVEIIKAKEMKTEIETKELKTKPETKSKRKPKK